MTPSNMQKYPIQLIGTFLALGFAVSACGNSLEVPLSPDENGGAPATDNSASNNAELYETAAAPVVNEFSFDQITGRGCGMTLQRAEQNPQDRQYILFNGLEQDDLHDFDVRMEMKINGEVVQFARTNYDGDEFAVEQYPFQAFISEDETLVVEVNVNTASSSPSELPPPANGAASGEIEQPPPASGETSVVNISSGTIVVSHGSQQTTIPVQGEAGC